MVKALKTSIPGIYLITNTISGTVYVGQARKISRRWALHKRQLRNGTHHCRYLQKAYWKYGHEAFSFSVAVDLSGLPDGTLEKALAFEEARVFSEQTRTYNRSTPTEDGNIACAETRALIGISSAAKWSKPGYKEAFAEGLRADWATPESREIRVAGIIDGWADPEVKARRVAATMAAQQELAKDPESKLSKRYAKRWSNLEERSKASTRTATQWADPEIKAKMREALKIGQARRRAREALAKTIS